MKSNRNKMISRIFVIIVCSLLLFVAVLNCYSKKVHAEPFSISIGLAALISSFFAAGGIALSTQNITNNQSFASNIEDIANQYSSETNSPQIYQWQGDMKFLYSNDAEKAYVTVSDTFASWLNGFRNWFTNNFGLTDSGETVVFSDKKFTTYTGESYLYYTDFSSFVNGKVPVSSIPLSTDPVIVNCKQGYYLVIQGYEDGFQYGYYRPGVRVQGFDPLGNLVFSNGHRYASETPNNFSFIKVCFTFDSRYNTFAINSLPTDAGYYDSGGYGFSLNGFLTLNDVTASEIGLTGSLTDGYDDFEQALEDAKTDAGENGRIAIGVGDVAVDRPVTQEGIANGILDNVITGSYEGTLLGGYTDDKEAEEDNDATVAPSEGWFTGNMIVVDGLEDFFPFCIPFDFYEIIRRLNVTPVAPKFNWKMNFGNTGLDDYDIEIDLSPYETVAIVFRIMFIIGFLVFLTMKTRDLIRG